MEKKKRELPKLEGDFKIVMVPETIDLTRPISDPRILDYLMYLIDFDPAIHLTIAKKYDLDQEEIQKNLDLLIEKIGKTYLFQHETLCGYLDMTRNANRGLSSFFKSKYQYGGKEFYEWRKTATEYTIATEFQYWITGARRPFYDPGVISTKNYYQKLMVIFSIENVTKIINNCRNLILSKEMTGLRDKYGRCNPDASSFNRDDYYSNHRTMAYDPALPLYSRYEDDDDDE